MDDANIRYFAIQLAAQMLPNGNPDEVIKLAGKLVAVIKNG
jgi:hypothetical protein